MNYDAARSQRPLWRDLILKIWGENPMIRPSWKGSMKTAGTMIRREEVQFFLRLHGLWEGIIALPPPPRPSFDIATLEPLDLPPQWGWSDDFEAPPIDWWMDEPPAWEAPELDLGDGRMLVLDATDPFPVEDCPVYSGN